MKDPIAIRLKATWSGDKKIAAKFAEANKRCFRLLRMAFKREALRMQRMMRTGIRKQAPGGQRFKPLAPSTMYMKKRKRSKALIDRGDLLKSINTDFYGKGLTAFVGVSRRQRDRTGNILANIAEIHEFGTDPFKIPITNKMRFWWLAQTKNNKRWRFGPLKQATKYINHPGIPARPVFQPVYDEWSQDVVENIEEFIGRRLLK